MQRANFSGFASTVISFAIDCVLLWVSTYREFTHSSYFIMRQKTKWALILLRFNVRFMSIQSHGRDDPSCYHKNLCICICGSIMPTIHSNNNACVLHINSGQIRSWRSQIRLFKSQISSDWCYRAVAYSSVSKAPV